MGATAVMDTLSANEIPLADLQTLRASISELQAKNPDSPLLGALAKLAMQLTQGQDVVLIPADAELTPSQVATLLRMSRPHVYRLLDAGAMPFSRVGRDRRVRLQDVREFMDKRERARRELAETFARTNQNRTALVARLAGVDVDTAERLGF